MQAERSAEKDADRHCRTEVEMAKYLVIVEALAHLCIYNLTHKMMDFGIDM